MQADVSYHISIPYGSIKSDIAFREAKDSLLFQFLMVRLKVFGKMDWDGN